MILLWAALWQAYDRYQETKKASIPGDQSVEIDVFPEEEVYLAMQNPRKVIFLGYSQKEHVTHPHTSTIAIMEKYLMQKELPELSFK